MAGPEEVTPPLGQTGAPPPLGVWMSAFSLLHANIALALPGPKVAFADARNFWDFYLSGVDIAEAFARTGRRTQILQVSVPLGPRNHNTDNHNKAPSWGFLRFCPAITPARPISSSRIANRHGCSHPRKTGGRVGSWVSRTACSTRNTPIGTSVVDQCLRVIAIVNAFNRAV